MNSVSASRSAPAAGTSTVRSLLGGMLMGLANLVPGISGGTMLLVAGVYPQFIDGIAEVTTLRFRARTMMTLAMIVGAAAAAIALFAGVIKDLVIGSRWAMYSVFIGLTLGGAPIVWRLLRPANLAAWIGCAGGVALMALIAFAQPGASDPSGEPAYFLLFCAGLAGAAAMILPGISGGYILLILGQYLVILSAIDDAKLGLLRSDGLDWPLVGDAVQVFIPVGLGVVAGVVGVSNLIRYLLRHYEKPTLGVLLGLLLGAVLGLWPFQEGVVPQEGAVVKGQAMTPALIAELDPEDYPLAPFQPAAWQVAASLGLIAAGFAATLGIARLGKDREP